MPRHYLQPEELSRVPIDGLSPKEARMAIAKASNEARISDATAKAAEILRDADVEVDDDTIIHLRKWLR